jgi:hypothetical protein
VVATATRVPAATTEPVSIVISPSSSIVTS